MNITISQQNWIDLSEIFNNSKVEVLVILALIEKSGMFSVVSINSLEHKKNQLFSTKGSVKIGLRVLMAEFYSIWREGYIPMLLHNHGNSLCASELDIQAEKKMLVNLEKINVKQFVNGIYYNSKICCKYFAESQKIWLNVLGSDKKTIILFHTKQTINNV